jgi:hypothetical protein
MVLSVDGVMRERIIHEKHENHEKRQHLNKKQSASSSPQTIKIFVYFCVFRGQKWFFPASKLQWQNNRNLRSHMTSDGEFASASE